MADEFEEILSEQARAILSDPKLKLDLVLVRGIEFDREETASEARRVVHASITEVSHDHISSTLNITSVYSKLFSEYWLNVTASKFRNYLAALAENVNARKHVSMHPVFFDLSVGNNYTPDKTSMVMLRFYLIGQLIRPEGEDK